MRIRHITSFIQVFLTCFVLLSSCKKNDLQNDNGKQFVIPEASPVTGSISGVVVDETNTPVPGAEVQFSGTTYLTNSRGFFSINNVSLDKYVSTVSVNKTGYFKALRSFSANPTRNYLSIRLIPKELIATIGSSSGGSATLANNSVITLPPNGVIIKSSGDVYNGDVKVYASYIDLTLPGAAPGIPGSLIGQAAGSMYVLQSAGMIAVELESSAGQSLQLAPGKTASVKLAIPASVLSKAPATIDTWSLDDRGIWIKEATATKNADFYTMEVSHFSFWNCDFPVPPVFLNIHLHDQNGNSLPNVNVHLTIPNNPNVWATTSGNTDSLGNISGLVPANEVLLLDITPDAFSCLTPVASQNIGPFNSNSSIDVAVTVSPSQMVTISGTANDCNNQPIQNGIAIITQGQYTNLQAAIVNGTYSVSLVYCLGSGNFDITAMDLATNAAATASGISITGSTIIVPLLTTCAAAPQAVYSIDGWSWYGPGSHPYYVNQPLNSTDNDLLIYTYVSSPGTYSIVTDNAYGMSFAASGVFTSTGNNQVRLTGSGTPEGAGVFTYKIHPPVGLDLYISSISVQSPGGPSTAVFNAGTAGQTCINFNLAGIYNVGVPLNATNTLTADVTVTSPGDYYLYTEVQNGIYFSKVGQFAAPGTYPVVLNGHGTPLAAGVTTFRLKHYLDNDCSVDVVTN